MPIQVEALTTRLDHAYKFKTPNGKWSPYLRFLKEKDGNYIFAPVEDNESTLETRVIHIFIAGPADLLAGKHFLMSKHYGMWEPA